MQVYPALKWLEAEGWVTGREEATGAPSAPRLPRDPAGDRALREWLRRPDELTFELRDRGLLKLFFADALEPEETLALVRAMRARAEEGRARFEDEIEPASARLEARFPNVTARYALEFNAWVADWCARLEAELAAVAA